MWKEIWFLVTSTLRTTFRKRSALMLYFGLPLAGVLLSMLLYGSQGTRVLTVGVVNGDGSQQIAADTIGFVQGLDNVKLVNVTKSELEQQLAASKLDSGLVIDSGYSDSVLMGNPNHITIESVKGATVTSYMKSMLYEYIDNVTSISKIAGEDTAKFKELYERYHEADFKLTSAAVNDTSSTKEMTYQSIGFLILFMMISAVNLSELMLKNRENRTYFRILSSPVHARTYLLSNIIVNLIVMIAQIVVTLFVMRYVFHLNPGVPLVEMIGLLTLFALVSVSISLAIVSFAKGTAGASAMENLIITPTCLLSGCFFPISIMPEGIRHIADFLPQNWVLQSINKLQTGASLGSIWFNLVVLLAFAIVFFLIAAYKIGRNNDTRNFV